MVFTEIKEKKGKRYYYRVKSIRKGNKITKERIYLGVNLDKKALEKAENEADKELSYLDYLLSESELKLLEEIKKSFTKQPEVTYENRYEAFTSLFTYDSTAIEGNTLTLQETSYLLFENRVPKEKSLREINETLNHKKAFDYVLNYKGDITKKLICTLHRLVAENTLKEQLKDQVGKYRKAQVFIRGVEWIPPKPEEVPREMKALLSWYSKNNKKLHPLVVAAYFHVGFETIHPFVDGNGRVGRLLMNFILHKKNYPMINVPNRIKNRYYDGLHIAQIKGQLKPFIKFLLDVYRDSKILF